VDLGFGCTYGRGESAGELASLQVVFLYALIVIFVFGKLEERVGRLVENN